MVLNSARKYVWMYGKKNDGDDARSNLLTSVVLVKRLRYIKCLNIQKLFCGNLFPNKNDETKNYSDLRIKP